MSGRHCTSFFPEGSGCGPVLETFLLFSGGAWGGGGEVGEGAYPEKPSPQQGKRWDKFNSAEHIKPHGTSETKRVHCVHENKKANKREGEKDYTVRIYTMKQHDREKHLFSSSTEREINCRQNYVKHLLLSTGQY